MSPQQPLQQFPAPVPPEQPSQTPYDFFLNPEHQRKPGLFSGGGKNRILLIIALVLVGVILIGGLLAVVFSGNKEPSPLVVIAQTQHEVIRVATGGTRNANSTKLQNFAVTTVATLNTAQRDTLALLGKSGTKLKTKELELSHNGDTDKALSTAQVANTYDTTFATTMTSELSDYRDKLEDARNKATSTAELNLIKQQISGQELLQKQLTEATSL